MVTGVARNRMLGLGVGGGGGRGEDVSGSVVFCESPAFRQYRLIHYSLERRA